MNTLLRSEVIRWYLLYSQVFRWQHLSDQDKQELLQLNQKMQQVINYINERVEV